MINVVDFIQQQGEVAITGQQYNNIDRGCVFNNIQGNADIPVAFCRTVAALDVRFQLDLEADISEYLLKTLLFAVTFVDGICKRRDYVPVGSCQLPEGMVIEMALIALFNGVIDVLHIDKDGGFLHFLFKE